MRHSARDPRTGPEDRPEDRTDTAPPPPYGVEMHHFRMLGERPESGEPVPAVQGRVAPGAHVPPEAGVRSLRGRLTRFAVVGGAGTVVNTAALYVLYDWGRLPIAAASAIAVELAVVHNYLLNDWWTFSVRAPSLPRFVKFNVSMLGGLCVNVAVVWALVHTGVHFVPANLVAIGAAFAVNFALSVGWVWRRRGSGRGRRFRC